MPESGGVVTDVVTGEAVVVDLRVARLASRVLALLIDLTTQFLLLMLVSLLMVGVVRGPVDDALTQALWLLLSVLAIVGYPATWETLARGRTPGKIALGLRVVSDDGGPERFRQALFRALAGVLEIWLSIGSIALVTSLASSQGKRLGDIFAGTLVLQERMPVRGGPVAHMPPHLASWAAGLELSRLPDDVALTARQYISRLHELSREARADMGLRIADAVAAYVSPPPPAGTPPEVYLSAVLAERRRRAEHRLRTEDAERAAASVDMPSWPDRSDEAPRPGGFAPPS